MKIALDYDNTITKDPYLWQKFAELAKERGHELVVVTSRWLNNPPIANYIDAPVIYCNFTAKRKHYQADVWIDDDPKHIDLDHGVAS